MLFIGLLLDDRLKEKLLFSLSCLSMCVSVCMYAGYVFLILHAFVPFKQFRNTSGYIYSIPAIFHCKLPRAMFSFTVTFVSLILKYIFIHLLCRCHGQFTWGRRCFGRLKSWRSRPPCISSTVRLWEMCTTMAVSGSPRINGSRWGECWVN